jgi:hypothetical protein
MTYCCFGTAPLAGTIPQDWPKRLFVDDAAALNSSDLDAMSVLLPADPTAGTDRGGHSGAPLPLPPPQQQQQQQGGAVGGPPPGASAASGAPLSAGGAGPGNGGGGSSRGGVGPMPTSAAVAVGAALPLTVLAIASGVLFVLRRRRRRRRDSQYEKQLLQKKSSRPHSHGDVEWGPSGGADGAGSSRQPFNLKSDVLPPLPPRAPPAVGPQIARTLSNGASWLANLLGVSPTAVSAMPPAHLLPLMHAGPPAGAGAIAEAAAGQGAGGAAPTGVSAVSERVGGANVPSTTEETGLEASRAVPAKFHTLPAWFGGSGSRGSSGSSAGWRRGTKAATAACRCRAGSSAAETAAAGACVQDRGAASSRADDMVANRWGPGTA